MDLSKVQFSLGGPVTLPPDGGVCARDAGVDDAGSGGCDPSGTLADAGVEVMRYCSSELDGGTDEISCTDQPTCTAKRTPLP